MFSGSPSPEALKPKQAISFTTCLFKIPCRQCLLRCLAVTTAPLFHFKNCSGLNDPAACSHCWQVRVPTKRPSCKTTGAFSTVRLYAITYRSSNSGGWHLSHQPCLQSTKISTHIDVVRLNDAHEYLPAPSRRPAHDLSLASKPHSWLHT